MYFETDVSYFYATHVHIIYVNKPNRKVEQQKKPVCCSTFRYGCVLRL